MSNNIYYIYLNCYLNKTTKTSFFFNGMNFIEVLVVVVVVVV
jgi:hypothetical protein